MIPGSELSEAFFADKAVATEHEDEFQRYSFAKRIAETIRDRQSADSLVLGLYGKWGLGKSSVLNFIITELAGTDVITISFNPWRFEGEEQLLLGFFGDLSSALEEIAPTVQSAVTKAVSEYAKTVVAKISLLHQHPDSNHLKELKSQAILEGLKYQIGELLHSAGKRILVLIDDIDRLATQEIQAIFRLVKLTVDFQYTTYLLAFDEGLVARAVGERYPGGGKAAGRRFLEKIIQVPLHLPMIQPEAMQKFFEVRLNRNLELTNTRLTDSERQRLIHSLSIGVMPRVTTPRHVSRYSNTLSMVLPLLRGEVNTVDLILLEALKVFYPELYQLITKNQERLIGEVKNTSVSHIASYYDTVFGKGGSKFEEAAPVFYTLFPNLRRLYGNAFPFTKSAPTEEDELYSIKSVASSYYFKRYFSYAVQEGEIPDVSFSEFLTAMAQSDVSLASTYALRMIQRASDIEFLCRLETTITEVTAAKVLTYCELLLVISNELTPLATTDRAMRALSRTSYLLLSYVNLLPKEILISTTAHLLKDSPNLNLANDLFRDITSMGHWSDDTPLNNFKNSVSHEDYEEFARIITDKVLASIGPEPWYKSINSNSLTFLNTWHRAYGSKSTTAALKKLFDEKPEELLNFLQMVSPAMWVRDDTTPQYLNFNYEVYSKLKDYVDMDYLYQVALQVVGNEALMPYSSNPRHKPTMIERAHQLLHHYANDEAEALEV
jgi:hypothetical protein